MPRMTAEFLRRLLSRCDGDGGVVPRLNGRVEPLAAFYPKTSLNLISEMILASKIKGVGDGLSHIESKLLSARGFAEKCVEGKFAELFDVNESEADFFSNWNSP